MTKEVRAGEQELNRKLAEWAEWTQINYDQYNENYHGYAPLGIMRLDLPYFTQSLDACFKWLVPRLPEGESLDMIVWMEYYDVTVWQRGIKPSDIEVAQCNILAKEYSTESLALALCLAIEKLIDKEG